MDLKSGELFWPRHAPPAPAYPPLERDIECDVAILGSGITGAMCAHYLVDTKLRLVIIDSRNVGRGSTAGSTGLLLYDTDMPLAELSKHVGQRDARRVYWLGREALDEFEKLAADLPDCRYQRRASLLLAREERDMELLEREYVARRDAGFAMTLMKRRDIEAEFSFSRPGGLLTHDAAEIDPYTFTSQLIRRAAARGVRVFGETRVELYDSSATHVRMTTTSGAKVTAGRVIFATGYETPEFLRDIKVKLLSTYVIATTPVSGFEGWGCGQCLLWETAHPYVYARTACGNRILAGGADEEIVDAKARDALIGRKAGELTRTLREMFPAMRFEVEGAYAGTFAETADSLPYIGPHEQFPRGLFALGYGGNGITFGLIAAGILRDLVLGAGNEDARIFRFER